MFSRFTKTAKVNKFGYTPVYYKEEKEDGVKTIKEEKPKVPLRAEDRIKGSIARKHSKRGYTGFFANMFSFFRRRIS